MSGSDPYQAIVEHLSVPLVVVSASAGTIRYANPAAEATFGLSHGALVDLPATELFIDPRQFQHMVTALARRGRVTRREALVRRPDGTTLAMSIAMESLFFDEEAAIVATFNDLTELRQMESDLKVTAQVEQLLSAVSTRFITLGPEEIERGLEEALKEIADVALADSGFLALLDETGGSVRRVLSWLSGLTAEDPPPAWHRLLEDHLGWLLGELDQGDVVQLSSLDPNPLAGRGDGGTFSLVIVPIHYDQGLRALLGLGSVHEGKRWRRMQDTLRTVAQIFVNVLKRRDAEEALAEEKERLSVTLGSIADGVIATDREGRIVLMNARAEKLTGWNRSQALFRPLPEVFRRIDQSTAEESPDPVRAVLRQGLVLSAESQLVSADGKVWPIEESAAPIRGPTSEVIGVVIAFGDVTERRQAEAEREKANKLEAVGLLAGGIAHDFRNFLLLILGNASLAEYCLDDREELGRILDQIKSAAERAKELTEQLLTFSKGGAPVKSRISISDLIHESVNFCFRGSKVVCEPEIAADLWQIEADAGQINQVLNNLLINANQAMTEGGRVRIVAENAPPEAVAEHELEGEHIRVRVVDDGPGMPPDVASKVFDPYFTTKKDGTGLGLATAHSIVKHHDGCLLVESAVGGGTTFEVLLPATGEPDTGRRRSEELLVTGQGRILVVDDENPVLELATGMLKKLGYEPEDAADGAEAVEKYRAALAAGRAFDAVLMDLTIPGGMGGREAVGQLLELDPGARVVVSSGYSQDPVMGDFEKHGFVDVLPKPFVITQLGQVLKRVLAGPRSGRLSPTDIQLTGGRHEAHQTGTPRSEAQATGATGAGPAGAGSPRAGGERGR